MTTATKTAVKTVRSSAKRNRITELKTQLVNRFNHMVDNDPQGNRESFVNLHKNTAAHNQLFYDALPSKGMHHDLVVLNDPTSAQKGTWWCASTNQDTKRPVIVTQDRQLVVILAELIQLQTGKKTLDPKQGQVSFPARTR